MDERHIREVMRCANSAARRRAYKEANPQPEAPTRKPPRDVTFEWFIVDSAVMSMFFLTMYIIGIMI